MRSTPRRTSGDDSRRDRAIHRLDEIAAKLRQRAVPTERGRARLALGGHVAALAWADRGRDHVGRRALLQLGLMEAALQTLGPWGMFHRGESLFPLFLLPDFHGPHFDEALRRLLLPGRGPFALHLAVTGVCPCRCSYCYAMAGGAQAPDLGDERLLEVSRAVAASGAPLIILGGGEPLSRFERLLQMIAILAPSSEVRLATSGVGLTPDRVSRLRDAGLKVLAVSLDSNDRDSVNTTRGYRRAFDAARAALRCSADAGLITFVTTVVSRSAFTTPAQIDDFLRFIEDIHPELLVNFLPKFATGRAASTDGFRSAAEYAPVAGRIHQAIAAGDRRATVFLEPLEMLMGCVGGGRRQMNIDIRGNVTACISGASFGNVLDEPFETLCARFSDETARLKRGFFCAHIGDRAEGDRVLDATESVAALESFYAAHPDTLFQRLLDVAGVPIAWLAEAGGPGRRGANPAGRPVRAPREGACGDR